MRRDRISILKACSYIFFTKYVPPEVTLLEIPPCQTPTCGVAYSCSYVLLCGLTTPFKFNCLLLGAHACTVRHGIQTSMEAILACHPASSTKCLDWVAKLCERWSMRAGPILGGDVYQSVSIYFWVPSTSNFPGLFFFLSSNLPYKSFSLYYTKEQSVRLLDLQIWKICCCLLTQPHLSSFRRSGYHRRCNPGWHRSRSVWACWNRTQSVSAIFTERQTHESTHKCQPHIERSHNNQPDPPPPKKKWFVDFLIEKDSHSIERFKKNRGC